MELDVEGMKKFLEEHKGETVFMFGFTFMIWQHTLAQIGLIAALNEFLAEVLPNHGGGWKKLVNEQVLPEEYKKRCV